MYNVVHAYALQHTYQYWAPINVYTERTWLGQCLQVRHKHIDTLLINYQFANYTY